MAFTQELWRQRDVANASTRAMPTFDLDRSVVPLAEQDRRLMPPPIAYALLPYHFY